MSATSTAPAPSLTDQTAEPDAPPTAWKRLSTLVSSAVAGVLGILPHVLHHVGPLAGAALFAGTAGALVFGAVGLLLAVPLLLRVHRRCGNWRVPAGLLAVFATVFAFSTFVIGPAISGGGEDTDTPTTSRPAPGTPQQEGHDAHH